MITLIFCSGFVFPAFAWHSSIIFFTKKILKCVLLHSKKFNWIFSVCFDYSEQQLQYNSEIQIFVFVYFFHLLISFLNFFVSCMNLFFFFFLFIFFFFFFFFFFWLFVNEFFQLRLSISESVICCAVFLLKPASMLLVNRADTFLV